MINDLTNWFLNLSTTDCISLLAFIVALYGAILSTIVYNKEKLKINLTYLNKNFFSYQKERNHAKNSYYYDWIFKKDLYTLAIYVRISNNSKTNTTINNFILNNKYCLDSSYNADYRFYTKFIEDNGKIYSNNFITLDKVLTPLISINPFESIEGFLIFENIKEIPSKFTIKINTVQKSKTYTLKIELQKYFQIEQ